MKKKVKARWLEALRSGEYAQTTGTLHRRDENGDRYCCLGVLCALAARDGIVEETVNTDSPPDEVHYGGAKGVLPDEVSRWAGLDGCNPLTEAAKVWDGVNERYTLAELNDAARLSFKQIADVIERDL